MKKWKIIIPNNYEKINKKTVNISLAIIVITWNDEKIINKIFCQYINLKK